MALVPRLGRHPEASEPDVAGVVDEYVRRLDVLWMREALPMGVWSAVTLSEFVRKIFNCDLSRNMEI